MVELAQIDSDIDFIEAHPAGQRRTLPPFLCTVDCVFDGMCLGGIAGVTIITILPLDDNMFAGSVDVSRVSSKFAVKFSLLSRGSKSLTAGRSRLDLTSTGNVKIRRIQY